MESSALTLGGLMDLGDPLNTWDYDVFIDGKLKAENTRIEVKMSGIHLHSWVCEGTELASEGSGFLTVRLYQRVGDNKGDKGAWTDIRYELSGLKTVLLDNNGMTQDLMCITQVFKYKSVTIARSK